MNWYFWVEQVERIFGALLLIALWITELRLVNRLENMDKKADEQNKNMLGAMGANMGLNTLIALAQAFGIKMAVDEMKPKGPGGIVK